MKTEVPITIKLNHPYQLEAIVNRCLKGSFLGHRWEEEWTDEDDRQLAKTVLERLKAAAEEVELHDIAESIANHWRDMDSPKGEYSSSSSPVGGNTPELRSQLLHALEGIDR